MAGLGVGVADALDVLKNLGLVRCRHGAGIGEAPEQLRRHLVDALVRTLGAEHHRHQQLECGAELQLRRHVARLLAEVVEHRLVSFFFFHLYDTKKCLCPICQSITLFGTVGCFLDSQFYQRCTN